MILTAAFRALKRLFTPPFRAMLWKSIAITLAILVLLWLMMRQFFIFYLWPYVADLLPGLPGSIGWIGFMMVIVFTLGLALIFSLVIAPITSFIGSFFMDDVAKIIEDEDFAADPSGVATPLLKATLMSLRFLGLSLIGNILALILFFVPGVNLIAFYVVNGYLLGREYFEFAARRFRSAQDASDLYRKNSWTIFLAGLLIAIFISIPIVNLVSPLFAAALMSYLHKALSHRKISHLHRSLPASKA